MAITRKDLLSISDLCTDDIWQLIERAVKLKKEPRKPYLDGKVLALIFEKPSLRTRVSFDVGMWQLGGHAIYLAPAEVGLGEREQIPDIARTLSRYVGGMVVRTFSHKTVESLAHHATVPVINGLTDQEHPCQVLCDLLTIYEKKGKLKGLKLAYIGDCNNVANSLVLACSLVGINCVLASPQGYSLQKEVLDQARKFASQNEAEVKIITDPRIAVEKADIVYTDVWISMGQEADAKKRRVDFAGYQVNDHLLSLAKDDALFMHPLPAHHREEVAEGMLDHQKSVVFDQAENRLHIQKAILLALMGTGSSSKGF